MAQILPEDTLYLIFLYASPSQLNDVSSNTLSLSPINFAGVCRAWRAAVAGRPSLWSHLDVDIHTTSPLDPRLLRVLETYLRNSGSGSLSFAFRLGTECTSQDSVAESITTQLLSQAHRWNDMAFQLHYPFLDKFLEEISLPPTPFLTSLLIGLEDDSWRMEKIRVLLDLSHCQQLQALTLRFGVKMDVLGKEKFRLESLTKLSLHVDKSNFEDFQKILIASPNLDWLDASISEFSGSPQAPSFVGQETLSLPKLTQLSLTDDTRFLLIRFLNWLSCPNLRRLTIGDTPPYESYAINRRLLQAFDEFIQRSLPPLTHLELRYRAEGGVHSAMHRDYSQIFNRTLHRLNDLHGLYLEGFVIDNQLIQELTIKENAEDIFWPQLKEAVLYCQGYGVLAQSMANMIVSRWDFGELKSLEYCIQGVPDVSEQYAIDQRVSAGLVLVYQDWASWAFRGIRS
ncbi:hypothetical protein SCHPADRAFT_900891 [Schizopora paradoxa]|uniref:Uncharacterized protein n=1 Tax=Schizopora paradoxa TaxID=27342 RepID=A0A0H2RYF2_9AGAM|nr:hypothetical protein SCHPADRAFT_900891 [Schizopora paradoxa]